MKNRVRVWHDDHDTWHIEYREKAYLDSNIGISPRNGVLLDLLSKLDSRGRWYKFFFEFLEFEYIPSYGL